MPVRRLLRSLEGNKCPQTSQAPTKRRRRNRLLNDVNDHCCRTCCSGDHDIEDFEQVDASLGGDRALADLRTATTKHGVRLVLVNRSPAAVNAVQVSLQSLPDAANAQVTDLLTSVAHNVEAGQMRLDLGGKGPVLLHRRFPDVAG